MTESKERPIPGGGDGLYASLVPLSCEESDTKTCNEERLSRHELGN